MAVLLGAGLAACEKEEDDNLVPAASISDPMQPKPLEVGPQQDGIGTFPSEIENPVSDEPPR